MADISVVEKKGLPLSRWESRFDDKKWRTFDIEGGIVILTDSGQRYLKAHPDILYKLHQYKLEADGQATEPSQSMRRYFNEGSFSEVYEIPGTRVVVKEADQTHSMEAALDRMDYLYEISDRLPRYIRVPQHLGLIVSDNLDRQYLIMEKANEGDTIRDFMEKTKFKPDQEGMRNLVMQKFREARQLIDKENEVLRSEITVPHDNLLTDWQSYNIIIDFESPTNEVPFSLWVIDQ